ncbi:OmpL47-type beta-barrel domain-containing protein [Isoptericola haloaureus]|uniref:Ig-like domain-containing protein n=1 Tax=Isoptericola haloaureus TaxID=1542902 RepID=A0ABU7Z7A7_9MICO
MSTHSDDTVLVPLGARERHVPDGSRQRRILAGATALALAVAGAGAALWTAGTGGGTAPAVAAAAEDDPANVALVGTPEASYTAPWHRLDAVHDGEVAPTGTWEQAWSTWSGERPASHWLEYSWPVPVTVDRSVMSFWTDGTGANGDNVRVPSSWSIQYWDADAEQFVDVPSPSGFGLERTTPNETTFDPVTTTRVRADLDALQGTDVDSYSAVGVTEWELWGTGGVEEPDPVDPNGPIDHEPVHVPTDVGVLPELPADLDAVYTDGRVETVEVSWEEVTAEDVAEPGSFAVAGTSPELVAPVEGTVHVRDGEPGDVVAVDYVSVVTLAGTAPVLPGTVVAEYADGTRDSSVPVTWDAVDPADHAEAGTLFFVTGDVTGTDVAAEATVFVVAPDDGEDAVAPTVTVSAEPGPATSGWFLSSPTVTVTATDDRDPSPAVEVAVDGGDWTPDDGPFVLEDDGEHTVAVRATDAAGNVGEGSRTLRVDTTAPATTATVRDLGTSVEVTLAATDAGSGVDRIQWEGPGTFWGTYTEPFTRALTDTEQVLEFAATDVAGNVEERGRVVLPALDAGDRPAVEATVQQRCLGGRGYVAVRAQHAEEVPVSLTVDTPYGSRTVEDVEPGGSVYRAFPARTGSVPAGEATVTGTATIDGEEVSATERVGYDAFDCG